MPIPAEQVDYLSATAARATSVHNTQLWRFKVSRYTIELYADLRRKLRVDPLGREMLISCGAAVFGLRLAVRSLGYLALVEPLPDPDRLRLLARLRLSAAVPITARERECCRRCRTGTPTAARSNPARRPADPLAGLQHDALAEGAALAIVDRALAYEQLAAIIGAADRRQDLDPVARAEVRRWSRSAGSPARDGVPAQAFPATAAREPGRLPQRDFDLGRGLGLLTTGWPPAATAVLLTAADGRADWLRAGQALHRLLARAASRWVFASLHTQPLEAAAIRALIRPAWPFPGPQTLQP